MPDLRDTRKKDAERAARLQAMASMLPSNSKPVPDSSADEEKEQQPEPEESSREITLDTLRGLYWLATPNHVTDKKSSAADLKVKLSDLLQSKDGMRTLLRSLDKFVFS